MKELLKKVSFYIPAVLSVILVVLGALIFNYIDKLPQPENGEDKDNYKTAHTSALVNLILVGIVFIFVAFAYFKTLRPSKNYITYF